MSSESTRRPSGTTATPACRMRSGRRPVRSRPSSVTLPPAGRNTSADGEHQARLAGTVGPEQSRHLARRDVQRNTVHDRPTAAVDGEAVEGQAGSDAATRRCAARVVLRAQVGAHDVARRAAPRRSARRRSACRSRAPRSCRSRRRPGSCRGRPASTSAPVCSGMRRMTRPRCSVSSSGRPAAGSSSSTTRGRPTTARAISTRRRSRAPSVSDLHVRRRPPGQQTSARRARPSRRDARLPWRECSCASATLSATESSSIACSVWNVRRRPQRARLVVRHGEQVVAERAYGAAQRPHEAAQHIEERRLTGAIRPDQPARARVEGHASCHRVA